MKPEKEHKYREVIERYCSVIGTNTALLRISTEDDVTYLCLGKNECEKSRGRCTNEKYGKE